ncbi:MAG: DUF2520 domain-containing protein [Firmicutes bacterium]|nr:DUF2520 domain-containing protein [Bacillota bacterium]
MRIAFIGAGNVGTALAVLLHRAGHEIVGVASRTIASASSAATQVNAPFATDPLAFAKAADVVFITTPDRAIAAVCEQTAAGNGFSPQTVVIHTSGAHSSTILATAEACGAYPLSFHPLQTFANPDAGRENLSGSFITIEGHEQALPIGRTLVADLQCKLLEIPTEGKALYHAAACIACNYITTVIDAALVTMEAAGVQREDGLPALYPLLKGTLNNIMSVGTTNALTGPIARGDTDTVETHLTQMEKKLPAMIPFYSMLACATVELATTKGTLGPEERAILLKLCGGEKE